MFGELLTRQAGESGRRVERSVRLLLCAALRIWAGARGKWPVGRSEWPDGRGEWPSDYRG